MILAALLLSAAVPQPVTTIVLDQRDQCGIGRVAYDRRAQSKRKANEIKRELEAQGRKVRIVTLLPGMKLDGTPGPVVMNPAC